MLICWTNGNLNEAFACSFIDFLAGWLVCPALDPSFVPLIIRVRVATKRYEKVHEQVKKHTGYEVTQK